MLGDIDNDNTAVSFEVILLLGAVDTEGLCDGLLESVGAGNVVMPTLPPLGINDEDGFTEGILISTGALG